MTRTVDSSFEVDGVEIEPDLEVCRPSQVPPAELTDPTKEFTTSDDPEETYNWMRVRGTYLDGDFVSSQVEDSRAALPRQSSDIVKSYRYVCIVDLRTELELYITEDRFAELFNTVLFANE